MKPIFQEGFNKVIYPCIASIKYDGEYEELYNGIATNEYGRKRQFNFCDFLPPVLFYAELIIYGTQGKNLYNEFLPNRNNNDFSLVLWDYKAPDKPYIDRINSLKEIKTFSKTDRIIIPDFKTFTGEHDLKEYYEYIIHNGYEGLVAYCNGYRVKLKAEYTADLIVMGLSKKRHAITLGIPPHIYCHASLYGKDTLLNLLHDQPIIKETQDDYLIKPSIVVEVKHNGIIRRDRTSLRNPRILRIRYDKSANELKEV